MNATTRRALWGAALVIGIPGALTAQTNGDDAWPLYGTLGPHSRAITTSSSEAQAYFNEGLQFMYAFGVSSARRSFQEAQRRDPDCAMCYWGEAWSLSPHLNGGMSVGAEREAYAALQRARQRLDDETPVERGLIEAFAARYDANPTEERRRPLDSAYARAIGDLAERFPDDLDIATLHGESLMLLRPRRGSVDLRDPAVTAILQIIEGVLHRNLRHPGACHLYIHLVEASPEPGRAEACADHLGNAIPGASHIRHMPSHIYMNIGRYGDAVRANQQAWHVDQQAAYGGAPGIYPSHNLHMLLFAAVYDGQSAVAIQAAKDLAKISEASSFYHPVTLAVFGRWDDVLALTEKPDSPFLEGMWTFARGMAFLRTDQPEQANQAAARLNDIITALPDESRFRFHPQATLLRIPKGILEGEIIAARGDRARAIRILRETVELEDGLVYDEPEPWHLPARRVLGALLLEDGQAEEAVRVYREALEDHPNSGWAYFGLEQALRALGRDAEADRAAEAFERHWARRDIWLRSSRF